MGIDNYKEVHHRLLHKARSVWPSGHSRGMGVENKEELLPSVNREDDSVHEASHHNEGESKVQKAQLDDTYTTVT